MRRDIEKSRQRRPAGKWRRRISIALGLVAVLLTIGIGGLWLRSVRHHDQLAYTSYTLERGSGGGVGDGVYRTYQAQSLDGGLSFYFHRVRHHANPAEVMRDGALRPSEWALDAYHPQFRGGVPQGLGLTRFHDLQPRFGFGYRSSNVGSNSSGFTQRRAAVTMPLWLPLLLVLALAGNSGWCARYWHRRQTRAARGLCPACGYDLRGSPAPGRGACPECGASVE